MAEEATTANFKHKSKWSKLISKDRNEKGHFKLNEDVVDFLKPSTDKYSATGTDTRQWSSAPRIDVAITQRWPDAGDVRKIADANGKQKRKKNVTVAFAKTVPDIIGQGGDECEIPVVEVSRWKARQPRSFSDRRPPSLGMAAADMHRQQATAPTHGSINHGNNNTLTGPPRDPYARPDMHRAKTSAGETSYQTQYRPVQPQLRPLHHTPQGPPPVDLRPGMLKRAPTGFSGDSEDMSPATPDADSPGVPRLPTILPLEQHIAREQVDRESAASPPILPHINTVPSSPPSSRPSSSTPSSPSQASSPPQSRLFVQKAQSRLESEARTFRRVSRQVLNEDDLVNLRNVSISSAEMDSPPRVKPAPPSQQQALKIAEDYQAVTDGCYTPEKEPDMLIATSPEQDRTDSMRPENAPVEGPPVLPLLSHQLDDSRSSTPTPKRSIEVPRIDTSYVSSPPEEGLFSPEKHRSSQADRPRSDSETLSPNTTLSPATAHSIASYMNFPSPNYGRPTGGLQAGSATHGFVPSPQGITPSSTHGSGGGYFASHPNQSSNYQAVSPSIPSAVSPSIPHPPSPAMSHAPSPSIPYPASPSISHAPSPSVSHGPSPSITRAASPMMSHAASPSLSSDPNLPFPRPPSQTSNYKAYSAKPTQADSAESVAYRDFDARVAHMKGVFRLTAEREHPISSVTQRQWLRAAIWWLHKGRAGLGQIVRNAPVGPDGQKRELLTQPHVDVAKTWWILSDILEDVSSPQSDSPAGQDSLGREIIILRSHLQSLTLSMQRNGVMPPHQSLIQGQDTTIWIRYPRFAPDAASLLRGSSSLVIEDDLHEIDPLEALPAGDSRTAFFYNRMFVNVSINTDDADTDRAVLPCILTMMRAKTDFQPTIIISSQADLVTVSVKPGDGGHGKGPTWHNVSWKARSHGIYVQLPRGFNLNIELGESDFRGLWNMIEYTRKMEASLNPQADERLIHKASLMELQYSDSSNSHAFPRDRVRACSAFVFERGIMQREGTGARRMHRGFRLLLITNPVNKTLSSITHELCKESPLLFENLGNPAANEAPAFVIRVQDGKRACKALMIFSRANDRQKLYDILNGITLNPNEAFVGQAPLKSCSIEPAVAHTPGSILPGGGALESLRWEGARIINKPGAGGQDPGSTVLSESLRVVASHDNGCITDRLNLGKLLAFSISATEVRTNASHRPWRASTSSPNPETNDIAVPSRPSRRHDHIPRHAPQPAPAPLFRDRTHAYHHQQTHDSLPNLLLLAGSARLPISHNPLHSPLRQPRLFVCNLPPSHGGAHLQETGDQQVSPAGADAGKRDANHGVL